MLPQRLQSHINQLLLPRLVPVRLHDRLLEPCIGEDCNGDGRHMLPNVCRVPNKVPLCSWI